MSLHNLSKLLSPDSVVVVGGSDRPGGVGQVVVSNLMVGGFAGAVHIVNPRRVKVAGALWSASIAGLASVPDLAVVITPGPAVPEVIAQLGARGVKVAVVISSGITHANGLRAAMLAAAKPSGLRIIGPNGLGLLVPPARLNASFARGAAAPGRLALISQSGALISGIVDWASTRDIGFSGIVSVGDMAEADLGDLLDLFAADPHTDAILMYVEGVTNTAKFMSAARAATRIKPVIALKAGRTAAAGKAALSHTGALAGAYDVHAVAFERAGIVMVETLSGLLDAATALSSRSALPGSRLAIVTNGGGAGILALDAMTSTGARLANLSPETLSKLDLALPEGWSHGHPIDVMGDAHAGRYRAALDIVLEDAGVDAVLVINCPTALSSPDEIARDLIAGLTQAPARRSLKPILACWLGDTNREAVGPIFAAARIPLFDTPDAAIRGFGYLVAAQRARASLTDAPTGRVEGVGDQAAAQALIASARVEGRTLLSEIEAKALLAAYGVPVVPTRFAATADDVGQACEGLKAPYAVKIISPRISHKSDVGGVVLDLADADEAVAAARAMAERIGWEHPEFDIKGFAVETMVVRAGSHEMIVGIADDATFGPVIMVGAGGKAVEVLNDKALGLPPLDDALARAMIDRTRISRLLAGYRDELPADVSGVIAVLEALSAIAVDLPDILELDINPLLVDAQGVLALDARIVITAHASQGTRMVIAPAPLTAQPI
ncbi:acetate--CoA ligase family protein [Caulobacter sp. DWR2-3-1b2]|uniref:acetate--CoA ligase family protein n=1 Tax=unclassified Caulobacter TaxID=2648921 RepID=UPI003CEE2866